MFPLAALASAATSVGGGGATTALTNLATAAESLVGPLKGMAGSAAKFVANIDPAIASQLQRAFESLDSVIGTALRPIVYETTGIFRNLADSLYPVAKMLVPIMQKMTSTLSSVFIPLTDGFARALTGLMPVFDSLADAAMGVGNMLGDLMQTLAPIIEVLLEVGKSFISMISGGNAAENVKSFFETLRQSFQQLIKSTLIVAATFMRFIGFNSGLDAMIRGLTGPGVQKEDTQGLSLKGVGYKDFASLGKQAYLNAFQASAFGPPKNEKKTDDFLKDISVDLRGIKDGTNISKLVQDTNRILENAKSVLDEITNTAKNILSGLPSKDHVLETGEKYLRKGGSGAIFGAGGAMGAPAAMINNLIRGSR